MGLKKCFCDAKDAEIARLQERIQTLESDLLDSEESLTAAYMVGYHKRDDLIKALQSACLTYEMARQGACVGDRKTEGELEEAARKKLAEDGLL